MSTRSSTRRQTQPQCCPLAWCATAIVSSRPRGHCVLTLTRFMKDKAAGGTLQLNAAPVMEMTLIMCFAGVGRAGGADGVGSCQNGGRAGRVQGREPRAAPQSLAALALRLKGTLYCIGVGRAGC